VAQIFFSAFRKNIFLKIAKMPKMGKKGQNLEILGIFQICHHILAHKTEILEKTEKLVVNWSPIHIKSLYFDNIGRFW
jgi:hypothetical protein